MEATQDQTLINTKTFFFFNTQDSLKMDSPPKLVSSQTGQVQTWRVCRLKRRHTFLWGWTNLVLQVLPTLEAMIKDPRDWVPLRLLCAFGQISVSLSPWFSHCNRKGWNWIISTIPAAHESCDCVSVSRRKKRKNHRITFFPKSFLN